MVGPLHLLALGVRRRGKTTMASTIIGVVIIWGFNSPTSLLLWNLRDCFCHPCEYLPCCLICRKAISAEKNLCISRPDF